jgi:ABC-type uncharacterized transport system ATPase subunit
VEGQSYAAVFVAPVLRSLVRHLVTQTPPLPTGEALEEAVAGFFEDGKTQNAQAAVLGDVTLLVLGLSGAGKTTLIAALQGELDPQASREMGFMHCP